MKRIKKFTGFHKKVIQLKPVNYAIMGLHSEP